VFIDFEGIDGSGKTTLSNRVAQRLEALGHRVLHARENGELKSGLARRVRELTRDARHLEMSARAEFFLNLSRDAQQLEEVILPALARNEVVISDRYLYSQLALTAGGRGLPLEALKAACELAGQGVWPELVVLVDVDPDLARWRKRLGRKPESRSAVETGSRKGLSGAGLNVRVRAHFLEQARNDPDRWLVLANEGQSLEALEERVLEAILARLQPEAPRATATAAEVVRLPSPVRFVACSTEPRPGPAACVAGLPCDASTPDAIGRRRPPRRAGSSAACEASAGPSAERGAGPSAIATAKSATSGFLAEASRVYVREPALALAMLAGFSGGLAHRLRLHALGAHPGQVALSLRDLDDEPSWSLREHLAPSHPREVARSLPTGPAARAQELRLRLFEDAAEAVLEGLVQDDGALAWDLRERGVAAGLKGAVLLGLGGVNGERAQALREEGLREGLGAHVALSLRGLADERAESLRAQLVEAHPLLVIKGALGVETPLTARLREALFPRALKPVLRSLGSLTSEASFALRERGAPLTKEAIDSLDGLDHPRAWALREAWRATWPTTVASSLVGLPADARVCSLLDRLLAEHPGRLLLLRNAALVMQVAGAAAYAVEERPRHRPDADVAVPLGQEGSG